MSRLPALSFPLILVLVLPAQEARAPFDAPLVVLPVAAPAFQRLLDIDGDGDLDAVGTRQRSDGAQYELYAWRNESGRFDPSYTAVQPSTLFYGFYGMMPLAVGDLDGDGRGDAIVGAGSAYHFYWGQPDGTFVLQALPFGSSSVRQLLATDLDGDQRLDIALLTRASWPSDHTDQLSVYWSSGGSGWVANVNPLRYARNHQLLAVDTDGAPGLEIAAWQDDECHLFTVARSNGFTILVLQQTLTATAGQHLMWAAGDVDRDGDQDLVAFGMPASSATPALYELFRRTGPTSWVREPQQNGGPAEYLADVDNDGDLDGVCCGGGGGGNPTWPLLDFASTFEIAHNDGTGSFARALEFAGLGSRSMAGAADVDGDGDVDLVAGAVVRYGRGPLRAESMMPKTGVNAIVLRHDALRDFDRDGDVDLFRSVHGGAENRGDGVFTLLPQILVPPGLPAGTAISGPHVIGDFDGDGAPDDLAPLFSGLQLLHMAFLRNNGSGHCVYAGPATAGGVRIGAGATVDHTATADLDGDGDLDAIGNCRPEQESRHCELYWNNGTGFFTAGPTFAADRFEACADFDGDAIPDLLTTFSNGSLRLWLGTGGAAFGSPLSPFPGTAIGTETTGIVVADANDDGRPDVLAVTVNGQAHLWSNTTTAAGAPAFVFAGPGWPTLGAGARVSAMELDGDGRTDLVLGPLADRPGVVQVCLRTAAAGVPVTIAGYQPAIEQVLPAGWPVDADGDGDLDLVGTHVVRNARFLPPAGGDHHQYGVASPGEAGFAPLLGATGPLRVGSTKMLRLTGVTGPTLALLAFGFADAELPDFPLPGITCNVDPSALLTVTFMITQSGSGRAGAVSVLPIWLPPIVRGLDFCEQVFVLDPAGPGGVAASNGLAVHVGG